MPSVNTNAQEETNQSHTTNTTPGQPVIRCGINRRIALLGYEHIDFYAGLDLPIDVELDYKDKEQLSEVVQAASTAAFEGIAEVINAKLTEVKEAVSQAREAERK